MSVTSVRPVVERVEQNLYERLQLLLTGIKPTSPVRSVVRPTRLGNFTPENWQIVLAKAEDQIIDELSRPGNPPAIAHAQRFDVHCHLLISEHDPTSIDEYVAVFCADVIEVITNASPMWYTMGDLCFNSELGAAEMFNSEGVAGFTLPVTCMYRVSEYSPYEMRA